MARGTTEQILEGSLMVFLSAIVGSVAGYLLRIYLARSLTVTDFGLFYAILSFVGFFAIFKDLGLGQAMVKFLAEYVQNSAEKIKSTAMAVVLIQLLASIAITIPIILFSDAISAVYFKTMAASIPLRLIAASFIIGAPMVTLQMVAQGIGKIKIYSTMEPMRIILSFILAYFLIGYGISGAALAYVIANVLVIIYLASSLKKTGIVKGKTRIDLAELKKLMTFGLPIFIGGLSGLLLFYTDTIMLTIFRGLGDVALYQAALPTSQILWMIAMSLIVVLLPVISVMHAKNKKAEIATALGTITKISFIIVVPLAMIAVAFAANITSILFGDAYGPAGIALQILSINAVFYTIFMIFSTALISIGKPVANTKITALIAVLNLAINIALVPAYGIAAASLATLASYIVGSILAYYATKKEVPVRLNAIAMGKIFAGGILSLGIIYVIKFLLPFSIFIEIPISLILAGIFYTVFVFKTKGITKEELAFLQQARLPIPRVLMRIVASLSS